jgi:DNA processing protein
MFEYHVEMDDRETAALVALLRRPGTRWLDMTDEVDAAGSAIAVLEQIESTPEQGNLFSTARPSGTWPDLDEIQRELDSWHREGIGIVTVLDSAYPEQLLTIHQRPPFLTYRGRLDPGDANGIAIVGTRQPSEEGRRRARVLAEGLAARGVPIISGLAAGIDTAALQGALAAGGRAVAVIGTGLRRFYPSENKALQARIGEDGLVLSQFWPDAPPTKHSFPMRNAVMSGYAAATVVIEAAWKSGARMQARLALEHGRPIFLLNTLLEHDWARDYARRPGAYVVSSVDDVIDHLQEVLSPVTQLTW